jgi:hypothetical protein
LFIVVLIVAATATAAMAQSTDHEPKADCPHATQAAHASASPSPYAGEQSRAIKALSKEQRDQLLAGHGMGLARAAELNRFPGPKHVLELAEDLELTAEQVEAAEKIFDRMHERARELGRQVIEGEASLEALFASGEIDESSLAAAVRELGRLQGELRLVHLGAHLEMRARMSETQIQRYDHLRGYAH